MNQKTMILFSLQQAPISSLVAFNKLGCVCLHKRIAEIENMGFRIDRENVVSTNRWGNRNDYTKYSFPKPSSWQQEHSLMATLADLSTSQKSKPRFLPLLCFVHP